MLLGAIVDPATIGAPYEKVCMQPEIVDTLRSVVSLPLLYADGTGKKIFLRSLAKESVANMLHIHANTICSTWHSEDNKLIHAAFEMKTAADDKASKVGIIGATNRPQDLDDTLLRRLQRRVLIDMLEIIRHYLTGENVNATVNVVALVEHTTDYSGPNQPQESHEQSSSSTVTHRVAPVHQLY
ncbi:hypothetical protein AURDEDRAFT_172914 [Auricularia subglabra TFB-10046 SS5]|nr:hypothetical protein AURDEDRAFT_172914 [Auricularia subglabra TFB-10046 SS5]